MRISSLAVLISGVLLTGVSTWSAELAKVNGRPITDKDLHGALSSMNEGQRQSFLKDVNSRRQVLLNIVDQELLVQEAEKQKVDQDQQYQEALAVFRRQYMANKVLEKTLGAKFSDAAAKKFYESHKSKFSSDQVNAQHILVSDLAQAKEILKKAKEPNADFQALAEQHSKDPSAKNNRGDLGFFGRDRMVPEFTEVAFSAKEGEIIGPVKTLYGYHIIKVIKKKPGKYLEFDEVEYRVKNELRNELIRNYVEKLKQQAKIQVDEKALGNM